jgi:hypothetical protein
MIYREPPDQVNVTRTVIKLPEVRAGISAAPIALYGLWIGFFQSV